MKNAHNYIQLRLLLSDYLFLGLFEDVESTERTIKMMHTSQSSFYTLTYILTVYFSMCITATISLLEKLLTKFKKDSSLKNIIGKTQ